MEWNHSNTLQDTFLDTCRKDHISLSMFLVNGIRLLGKIEAFDAHTILLKGGGLTQLIYKHAVSTILPSEYVYLNEAASKPVQQQQPVVETPVVNEPQAVYETEAATKPEVIVKKRVTRRRVVEPEVETIE